MLKALAVFALVLLVLLLAIPLAIGMAMTAGCPECQTPGSLGGIGLCLAILSSLMLVALGFRELAAAASPSSRDLLLVRSVDRPPQPLSFI
jgi:hypothetical protein